MGQPAGKRQAEGTGLMSHTIRVDRAGVPRVAHVWHVSYRRHSWPAFRTHRHRSGTAGKQSGSPQHQKVEVPATQQSPHQARNRPPDRQAVRQPDSQTTCWYRTGQWRGRGLVLTRWDLSADLGMNSRLPFASVTRSVLHRARPACILWRWPMRSICSSTLGYRSGNSAVRRPGPKWSRPVCIAWCVSECGLEATLRNWMMLSSDAQ
jgi:hypothetical protein